MNDDAPADKVHEMEPELKHADLAFSHRYQQRVYGTEEGGKLKFSQNPYKPEQTHPSLAVNKSSVRKQNAS